MAKVTLATIKRFIKANRASLHISCRSSFDGMQDCVTSTGNKSFRVAESPEAGQDHSNCLGVRGAWFVFGSRDSFSTFSEDGFTGYRVYNCCGSFVLAVPQIEQVAA